MVTDAQVRRLMREMEKGTGKAIAADKAGMDEKTARTYVREKRLPSEIKAEHGWRTRTDPFGEVWDEIKGRLGVNARLEAKTLFEDLLERYPEKFGGGQLRTLQRKIKRWRAEEGPAKEVFFPQEHYPGVLSESDFTRMKSLGITISGSLFDHLIYHFVLTYSNWEAGTICFSESFESVSEGLQNALWELGGVPQEHQTDCLTAAVRNTKERGTFTDRYEALLRYYQMAGRRTNPSSPNENGDIESRNNHFKRSLDQALLLRGSRDFESRQSYEEYLRAHIAKQNARRLERFTQEKGLLSPLPVQGRLENTKRETVRVGPSSTIRVKHNTYSVNSRLVGEWVEARLYHERIEIWYGQKQVETLPRLRGEGNHHIQYRHIIDYLVRKPGAFRNYRYRSDMFPTIGFRICYDALKRQSPLRADKEYLKILHLAARRDEEAVECAINHLLGKDGELNAGAIEKLLSAETELPSVRDVAIDQVALSAYDALLPELEIA
jgi:hypothetical protein